MASRDVSKSWFLLAALLVGMGFLPAAPAVATDSSWSFYGGGQWSDPVNWSNGVPNGVDDVARFTVTVTNGARPFIDSTSPSGVTLGSLYISGDRYYVTYPSNSAAPSITFSTSGGPALFQADSGGVYCNVVLNAPLMFATNVSGASLMGVVSGSNSAYGITLTGSGNHGLSGANTYAGPTIIAQGTLIATDGVGLPTASNLVLAGGILRGPSGATFTRGLGTSPGLVHWTGSGGFGCWSGTYTVNLGGHATPDTVVWGQNGFVPDGSALMLSGADFRNPIDLAGGSREIFAEYTFSSTLSGAVSNGSLVKTGTGTLTFNAPSASTTLIDVTAGTLELKSNCSISGTVRVGPSGTLTVTSPNASVGTLLLQGGAVSYSGGVLSASTTFDLQKGDCSANLSGPGSLVKTTPDRVSLSGTNTYSGDTVLAEGRLYVGSAALSPNSNLVLKGGSLESSSPMTRSLGTGPGQVRWAGNVSLVSSSTTFTINLGGQTPATPLSWGQQYFIADGDPLMLNSTSAWGTVDFQNPIDLGSVNRTVQVVDGPYTSVTDIAILSGALTGAGGLVKTGNGTLSLTAANGYGGPTVISDGAVRAIDGTGLPAGSNLVLAGGALEGNGATSFVRGLGTDPGQVQWTGSGGFSAGGGKMSVNIGGQAAPITLTWGSGGFVPAGSEFLLGSRSSSGEVEFANPIDLAGALRTLRVEKNLYQNANDSASLIGPLSNGGLVKTGAGLLVLKGQNTFTGGAWVNAGTLRLAADSAIAGGCPVTVAGGTLDLQTFNVAAGTVTLLDGTISGTTGVLSATGYDLRKGTISGQIGGAAGVVKTTADTVILSGANSYAGLTTVSEGALQIKSAGALGSAAAGTVVLPGAALELYKASVTNESLTISGVGIGGAGALRAVNPYPQSEGSQGWLQGPITLAGNTTIGVECSNALVLNCPINDQGSGYGLKKVGTGPLQLLGANSYSGPTIIAGGSLTATDGVGLPTASNLALAGGTVLLTNGQTFTRAVGTDPGQVQWTTGGGVTAASGTATVNLGGHATPDALTWGAGGFVPDGSTLLLSATSGGTIVFQNPINLAGGDRAFVGGTLSGALSNGGVTVAGGVVTLNAANTYAGATRVKSGTLRVGRADAIPGNSPASVEGGATFDIGAYAVTAGPVTLVDGLITGTTGVLTSAADYDLRKGTVSAILGGTAGLTKTTADYVELRGANSYTGLTRILNGTLSINNNSALGTTDAGTVIEPSGTLNFNTSSITTSEPITVGGMGYNGMGALRSNGTFNGPITVTSHTCFDTGSGGGTTTFNGPITSPYDIRLTGGGTVVLANPANAITGRLEIGRGTLKLGAAMSGLQPAALSLFEESPGSGNGTPVFDMQLYSVTIGSLFLSSGTISGSSGAVLTASDAQLQSGRLSPSLAGTCGVTKTSANTVTLEGNNSYTGLTNVLEGTLKITHPNALGASSAGTRIAPGATLQPIFSSWGTIVAEPLTLGGAGVNGSGAIYLETYGVAFTGPVTLESDTTVRADKSTDVALPRIEFQGPVGGAGGLTKTGGGELDLCAAGTYAGPTTVAEGRLGVRNGAALGSTSTRATVASGACLSLEGNIAVGPKPLTISGEGYSRPYYPTQFTGALYADGGIHSWAGPVHMDGDGTIRVYGSMGSGGVLALTGGIEDGGSGYVLTKRGSGTLVLTGTGAWGGATVIQNGAIRATEGVGLPSTTNLRLSHLHTDGDFSDDNIPGVLEGNGPQTFSRSLGQLPGQVQWLDGGGFSAHGGKMTVNIGGQTTPTTLVWGVTPYFVPAYSSLALGSYTADSETEFRNPIDLGSTSRSIATYRDPKSSTALATLSGMLSGTGNILVGGNAVLFLAATNNYTGTTSIGSGAVRAVEGVGLPVASPLKFSGSGVYETVGTSTFTRGLGTTAGKVYWAGGGGFSAYGGKLTVNIGGNATPSSLTWDTTNFVPSGSPLWFGSPSSDSEVEFRNPINLNGKYTGFVVNDNPATVADFATLSGVLSNGSLEKWGLGTLVFSAANTYQGNTTIWEGALRAADGVGLPSASNLAFGYAGTGGPPGGTLEGSGATTFTRSMGTGAAMVRWSYSGGFSAYGGKMTVAIGGTSSPTPLVWGSGNFVPNNYALIFGSSTANSETEFKNSIDLAGAARTITVNDNPFSTGDFATLSGQISNGGLIKDGSGTLVLTGANTYEGTTTVKAGALRATIGAGLPAAGNLNLSGGVIESIGATTFTRNLGTSGSNTLQWTGSGGFSAGGGKMTVAVGGTGSPTPLVWGAGNFVPLGSTLMFGSPAADSETELKNGIDLAGGDRTVFVDDNPLSAGDFATISGVVSSTSAGLVKDGPGTLLLSGANTYTGATTVVAGALRAADGAGLPAASNLVLGGGVLV